MSPMLLYLAATPHSDSAALMAVREERADANLRCGIPRPRERQIRSPRGRPSRRAPVGAGGRARSGPARPLGGDSPRVGRRRATRGSCGWWSRQIRLGSRAHDCRWISRDRRPQVDLPRVLRQTPLVLSVASNHVAQFFFATFLLAFSFSTS